MPAVRIIHKRKPLQPPKSGCGECKLGSKQYTHAQDRGKVPCDLLIIGDHPSHCDDLSGLVLSGNEWRLFYHMLERSRLTECTYYIANLLRCRPTDSRGGSNRDPSSVELACCRKRVLQIIDASKASAYLLMGELAVKYLRKLLPGYFYIQHPNFILSTGGTRSPFYLQNFRKLEDIYATIKNV